MHADPRARRHLGERPPATTDLQDRIPRPRARPVEDRAQLGRLRRLMRFGIVERLGEDRARIGQARIEPRLVEIVAEVVMRRDVAARTGRVVTPHPVPRPCRQTHHAARSRGTPERAAVAHEQVEQRHRIRARPVACRPALVPTDRPRRREPHQRAPAMHGDDRQRPRRAPADQPPRAIGQSRIDPAALQPRVDPVEQPVENRRDDTRDRGNLRGGHIIESGNGGHRGAPCNRGRG